MGELMNQLSKKLYNYQKREYRILFKILINNNLLSHALMILTPDDFMLEESRLVFETMIILDIKNEPIDLLTLANENKEINNEFLSALVNYEW